MAMPMVTMSLPVNIVMTAMVAKAFVLPKATIGLISAMPFVGNFLQIFATPFLTKWRPPKTITVLAASMHLVTWIGLGIFLPWIPRDDPTAAGHWLIAWFLLSSCFAAVAGVSWNAWILEWVPGRLRGKFFGRRNGALQVSTLTFLLIAGWAIARWNYAMPMFQLIIAGAAFMRVFSLHLQWQSPTREPREAPTGSLPIVDQLRVLAGSRSLLLFIVFGAVWAFAANCFGPFYSIFMFEQIGFSAFNVGVVYTLSQLGGALSLPAWGQLLDRYGNKPVMILSLILWQTSNFIWCFLTPQHQVLLYMLAAWGGITSAGFVLGQFTILMRLLPVEAKNLAIGVNLAFISLVAALAPIMGGQILGWALGRWSDALAVYHWCFVLQPVLALGGAFLLLRVREPAASPFSSVVGAMRNIRTLSGVLGLSFLVNYVFFKVPRKPTP
ncbi:MAG: MFS transporter [Opitutaceae bacterium]|nr:MFS transporter [Opitutaceae bacterium]